LHKASNSVKPPRAFEQGNQVKADRPRFPVIAQERNDAAISITVRNGMGIASPGLRQAFAGVAMTGTSDATEHPYAFTRLPWAFEQANRLNVRQSDG
jgi:hypothetical protein